MVSLDAIETERRVTERTVVAPQTVTRIRVRSGWESLNLGELWSRRELLWFLAWRDIRVRYKQTVLGAGWAILQPLLQMVVFSIVFGKLLNIPTDTVQGLKVPIPYPVFSMAALVPWGLFGAILAGTAGSLIANAGILTKVFIPRLLIPMANVVARLVDFCVAFVILMGMILAYRFPITLNLIWIPVFLLLLIICALGFGLWLSALNMYIRDIQMLVPFLVTLWEFASPVVYSASKVPDAWKFVYALNPMAGVLIGFRWCLFNTAAPGPEIWASVVVALVMFLSGVTVFQRVQRNMVDIL
jgi:lipopolysaccharide transport system permease protein